MSSAKAFPEPTSVFTAGVLRETSPGAAPGVKIARAMRVHKAGCAVTKAHFSIVHRECWPVTATGNCLRCKNLLLLVHAFVDDAGVPGIYMLATEHPSWRYSLQTLLEQYGLWDSAVLETYTMTADIFSNLSTVLVARLPELSL